MHRLTEKDRKLHDLLVTNQELVFQVADLEAEIAGLQAQLLRLARLVPGPEIIKSSRS